MVSMTLWWLLLIPIFLALCSVPLLPKLSQGRIELKESLIFAGIGLLISIAIMSGAFFLAKGSMTHDSEIWNGRITQKERKHDQYTESYSCNCRTDAKGNSHCDTCTREHYTVEWLTHSTIGSFRIQKLDETDNDVYATPNPKFYTDVVVGEPCSKVESYTNYIKAVPQSLFRPASDTLKKSFVGMIPAYPISIYEHWRVDRVLGVNINIPNLREWNAKLSDMLKDLGNAKQVNAAIVFVKTADETYSYALQDAWLNGKKNDVIVIIGTTDFPNTVNWVHVLALTDNTIFPIKLQDDIQALPSLEVDAVIGAIKNNISKHYKRKSMKDFAYLDAEIDPPTWVSVTTGTLIFLSFVGFWIAVSTGHAPRFMSSSYSGYHRRRFR